MNLIMNHKKKERLRKEQNKLNNDGMNHWIVKISDKEEKYIVTGWFNLL